MNYSKKELLFPDLEDIHHSDLQVFQKVIVILILVPGFAVGSGVVGSKDGLEEGFTVGWNDGSLVGVIVGLFVRKKDGSLVGFIVGKVVGL